MAVRTQWTAEHACSHRVDHDLSNRPADKRAAFARWLASKDCSDCWKAARDADSESKAEWLAAKRAEEQEAAVAWAKQFDMPQLEGPEKALDWGERSRHQLMTAAHTALVVESFPVKFSVLVSGADEGCGTGREGPAGRSVCLPGVRRGCADLPCVSGGRRPLPLSVPRVGGNGRHL
jgi:hypothetical protein